MLAVSGPSTAGAGPSEVGEEVEQLPPEVMCLYGSFGWNDAGNYMCFCWE